MVFHIFSVMCSNCNCSFELTDCLAFMKGCFLNVLFRHTVDIESVSDLIGFRTLDNMKASKFAISGTRKVACVVSATIRCYRNV